MMLNQTEKIRYHGHIQLLEIGLDGQEKLKQSRVLVVGAGGLGCSVLTQLSALGIGTIGVLDLDVVKESNLHRQFLYTPEDLGQSKVSCAVKHLSVQNPHVDFISLDLKLDQSNALDLFSRFDIIVDGSDNLETRYLINDACVLLEKPFVYGSVHRFEAQLSVFLYQGGPSFRCLFPENSTVLQALSCSETGVVGIVPNQIGILQALEVLKMICDIGDVLSGKLLLINLLQHQQQVIEFSRNESAFAAVPSDFEAFGMKDYHIPCEFMRDDQEISAHELSLLLKEKSHPYVLIDIRNPDEIPRLELLNALEIPSHALTADALKIHAEKTIVLLCQSGVRSREAIRRLDPKSEHKHLKSLSGGISAWIQHYSL